MSRPVPAEELDLIERVISEYPEGLGISALERALAPHWPNINRRTLQRRLKRQLQERRIISEGESIALVYRRGPGIVEISGPVFLPLAMPQVLEECFRLVLQKAAAIPDPFEQAFFVMVQLPYLQPLRMSTSASPGSLPTFR